MNLVNEAILKPVVIAARGEEKASKPTSSPTHLCVPACTALAAPNETPRHTASGSHGYLQQISHQVAERTPLRVSTLQQLPMQLPVHGDRHTL